MPTTYQDQFWIIDPYAPPPAGTLLTVNFFTIVDNNDNGLINRFSNDSIDGSDIVVSYPGDTVTVQLAGGATVTITGVTFYLADGRTVFTPSDGSTLSNATLVSTTWVPTQGSMPVADLGPPCFTPGTLIECASGPRPVEELRPGALVLTADDGLRPLVAVHRRRLSGAEIAARPRLGPVCIAAGALGEGLPRRDLAVSPQHRMLISSPVAERMFGSREILAPACQLVGLPGIARPGAPGGVDYIHLLLDHHAVIFAEAAPTESLFLGRVAGQELPRHEIARLMRHLPDLLARPMEPARPLVRGRRLQQLLRRHEANAKPLLDHPPRPCRPRGRARLALAV